MPRKRETYGHLPSTLNSKGHPLTCLCRDRGEAKVHLQPIRSLGARSGMVSRTAPPPLLHWEGPRLGERRGRIGRVRKVSSPPDRPAVASHYTDYVILAATSILIFQGPLFSIAHSKRTNQYTRKTGCILVLYFVVRFGFTNPSSEYPHQDGVLGCLSPLSGFSSNTLPGFCYFCSFSACSVIRRVQSCGVPVGYGKQRLLNAHIEY
jgi:hypothetical protein